MALSEVIGVAWLYPLGKVGRVVLSSYSPYLSGVQRLTLPKSDAGCIHRRLLLYSSHQMRRLVTIQCNRVS